MKGLVSLTMQPEFKPGDPPPTGYLANHEWAAVQLAAGLRQVQCGQCQRWKFPQELAQTGTGVLCRECAGQDGTEGVS